MSLCRPISSSMLLTPAAALTTFAIAPVDLSTKQSTED
jgi:hypothetical protein